MPRKRRQKLGWEFALENAKAEVKASPRRSVGRPTPPMMLHAASLLLFAAARDQAGPNATPKQIATIIVSHYPPDMQTADMVDAVKRWLRDQSRGVCPGVGIDLLASINL